MITKIIIVKTLKIRGMHATAADNRQRRTIYIMFRTWDSCTAAKPQRDNKIKWSNMPKLIVTCQTQLINQSKRTRQYNIRWLINGVTSGHENVYHISIYFNNRLIHNNML